MDSFQTGTDKQIPDWANARWLNAFVVTADTGSLSATAARLGVTPSAVSKVLQALEHATGHTLFWRNTRRLSLSPAGERLLPYCRQALEQLSLAGRELAAEAETISGRIKVSASAGVARRLIASPLADWLRDHYGLVLEWVVTTRFLMPAEDGVDVLLRVAARPPEEWVAVPLWQSQLITVASPDYLDKNGRPESPSDLPRHRCLVVRGGDGVTIPWQFSGLAPLPVQPAMIANDESILLGAAEASLGIAQALDLNAMAGLEAGRLLEVLPDRRAAALTVFALRPAGASHGKLRAFVEAVAKNGSVLRPDL